MNPSLIAAAAIVALALSSCTATVTLEDAIRVAEVINANRSSK